MQALEKSKYEQSLESVRRFIAIAEKELELYYRHVALYGDPNNRNPISILDSPTREDKETQTLEKDSHDSTLIHFSSGISAKEVDPIDEELSETEDDLKGDLPIRGSDSEKEFSCFDEESEGIVSGLHESDEEEDWSLSDSCCDEDGEGSSYTKLGSYNVSQRYDSKQLNS